jgi:hypothetical protein
MATHLRADRYPDAMQRLVGPYLVTQDEAGEVHDLDMWFDVNGERMQPGNTRTMIFDCAKLVSYISKCLTLLPGGVITIGTPPGVGLGMRPPRFLKPGDVMTLGIEIPATQGAVRPGGWTATRNQAAADKKILPNLIQLSRVKR